MRSTRQYVTVAISLAAIVFALRGSAGAATGQVVNIADGTTASYIAKVDSTGKLQTKVTGLVSATITAPTTPFRRRSTVVNYYYTSSYPVVLGPTKATLAITRIGYSNSVFNTETWELYLYRVAGTSASECNTNLFGASSEVLEHVNLSAASSFETTFPTPLVTKPFSPTGSYCLMAGAGPAGGATNNNTTPLDINFDGFVVSGTFTSSAISSAPKSGLGSPPKR
jgi:hypothetical protein